MIYNFVTVFANYFWMFAALKLSKKLLFQYFQCRQTKPGNQIISDDDRQTKGFRETSRCQTEKSAWRRERKTTQSWIARFHQER